MPPPLRVVLGLKPGAALPVRFLSAVGAGAERSAEFPVEQVELHVRVEVSAGEVEPCVPAEVSAEEIESSLQAEVSAEPLP